MKNKFFRIIILTLTLVLLISALASCGDKNADGGGDDGKDSGDHKHTFVWHQDDTGHLQELTCGCEYENTMSSHNDSDENGYCDDCNFNLNAIAELSDTFKTAYVNSFATKPAGDFDKIYIRNYFGMIGDAHIVSIYSDYVPYPSGKGYPDDAYIQRVEGMEFRYDIMNYVYIIHNEKLYSAKSAYENKIIDFNGLCKVFGLHTSKKHTFNEKVYNDSKSSMKLAEPEWADYYELKRYYGEYNGYHAVAYNFRGGQAAVSCEEQINNLNFSYGYKTCRIRLINDTEMYTLGEAKEKGIITDADVYELFIVHTKSQGVNEELLNALLTPAYELCLKYKEGFRKEVIFENFFLDKYYGKYGDSYVFALSTPYWVNSDLISASAEEIDVMQYGFGHSAYVLNDGKLYTLDQAFNAGLITEEAVREVTKKYYGVG